MKLSFSLAFAFGLVLALIYLPVLSYGSSNINTTTTGVGKQTIIPGEFIVVLKPDSVGASESRAVEPPTVTENVLEKARAVNDSLRAQGAYVDHVWDSAVQGYSLKGVTNSNALLGDPSIKSIEPTTRDPVDTQYHSTGMLRVGMHRTATPDYTPNGRETKLDIDVAVIDGMVHPHPDLNIFRSVRFLQQADTKPEYHGTHVAGICCSRDNLGGVVGPAQGARIWSLHICGGEIGNNFCSASGRLSAYNYVIQNAAAIEVVTMSVAGGVVEPQSLEDAGNNMINAGVAFFRSAGNTGTQCESDWGCSHNSAIVVSNLQDLDGLCGGKGSTTSGGKTFKDDVIAPSSTYGSQIDIMAPGSAILSTWPGGVPGGQFPAVSQYPYIGMSSHGYYAFLSGTSMATPLAAGVGALIMLNNPSFTHAQVKSNMQTNGIAQGQSCDGSTNKGGLVSGANAKGPEKLVWAGAY